MNNKSKENLSEIELLLLLRQGDTIAFTAIYKIYSKALYLKILRMTNDEENAKEILQDLFMKIWETRAQINTECSFKSYLYTVGINLVYDYFRKAAKNKQMAARLLLVATELYTHTEEALMNKESMTLIHSAVNQLPPQRKKVYTLCRLEGKSYEDVSKELHISTSTIQDHMVKANTVVRNYLLNHPDIAAYSLAVVVFSHLK